MPKETKSKKKSKSNDMLSKPHAAAAAPPLGQVIADDETKTKYANVSRRQQRQRKQQQQRRLKNDENDGSSSSSEEEFMDEKTSKRILDLSRTQLLDEERRSSGDGKERDVVVESSDDDEEEEEKGEVEMEEEEEDEDDDGVVHDEGYVTVDGPGFSAEQEAVVSAMMSNNQYEQRKTLADIILAKIAEKEAQQQHQQQPEQTSNVMDEMNLPPKVIQVYTDIGKILSIYTSGKLPKAFKVIPSLSNWEDILYLTQPHNWTPQATFAATRIFASNLNPKMAQRFFNLVLLDAVRADIHANQKLNYHYYNALIKAAYKPAAFFKGIVLPLAKPEARCTLREAAIVASALRRASIPVHHSAVAIQKLACGEYAPAASIFLRELLNKKYSLPHPVIRSLVVDHFGKFREYHRGKEEELPVLWHQSLLVFVQRYKVEIGKVEEYKEILKGVLKVHCHPKITREVRRELFGNVAWMEERKTVACGGEDMEM